MNSRVRDFKLRLLVHDEDRDAIGRIQQQVRENFAVAVINALERALHSRFHPDVILRVRELSVRWSLAMRQLSDPDYTRMLGEELAEQLAAQIVRQPAGDRLRPSHSQSTVLFQNVTHLRAARLSDEIESKASAWFYDGFFMERDAWSQARADGAAEIKRLVAFLERMGTLTSVLARFDAAQIRTATAILPLSEWPPEALGSIRASALEADSPSASAGRTPGPSLPSLDANPVEPPSTGGSAMRERSPPAPGNRAPPAHSDTAADRINAEHENAGSTPRHDGPGSGDAESGMPDRRAAGRQPKVDGAAMCKLSAVSVDPGARPASVSEGGPYSRDAGPAIAGLAGPVETQFGGLFYLLNSVLELDFAEHLWCAGVKEGEFLCHVTRLILGADGGRDPAPRILGGIRGEQDPALAALPAWAEAEIRTKSLGSLRSLLKRRQAPAIFSENLEAKIDELAAGLHPLPGPGLPDQETTRGVQHGASVVMWAFLGRFVERLNRSAFIQILRVPGWIEPGPERIQIHLPLDRVDIRVRRAGLDFNPGYLPWLKRKLGLIFE